MAPNNYHKKTSFCSECWSGNINYSDLVYLPLIEGNGRAFPWCMSCGLVQSTGKPQYPDLIEGVSGDPSLLRMVLSFKQAGAHISDTVKFLNKIKNVRAD